MMWLADQGVSGAVPPESRAASTVTPWAVDAAQTLGTILTRASCTALSRSASSWGSWYGMARMR